MECSLSSLAPAVPQSALISLLTPFITTYKDMRLTCENVEFDMSKLVFFFSLSCSTRSFNLIELHRHLNPNFVLLIVVGLAIKLGSMFSRRSWSFLIQGSMASPEGSLLDGKNKSFTYETLQRQYSIRIWWLYPGHVDDLIRCDLSVFDLDSMESCQAYKRECYV